MWSAAYLPSRQRSWHRDTASLVAALFLLNAILVLGDFVETPWALLPAELSLELAGLAVLFAIVERRGRPISAAWRWLAALALLVLLLMRLSEILVPWFFGRDFNLVVDVKYLPFFIRLIARSLDAATFAAIAGGALLALLGGTALLRALVGAVARGSTYARSAGLAVVGVAALIAHLAVPARYDLAPLPLALHFAKAGWRQLDQGLAASGLSGRHLALIEQALAARPSEASVAGFGGRHVLLIFAESYGAITLSDPALAAALAPLRARFAARAAAAGYHVYSSLLNAPITGGGSWLAHATLTTGIRIDSQPLYEVMLASRAAPLGRYFREAGYRTVAAMPRMQQPWPHGAFFAFDAVLDDAALAYAGPRFTWETSPDQFVLERVHEREIARARQPLFIQYVLSSSQLPFDHVPPLIEDGRTIGEGRIYAQREGRLFPPSNGQVFDNTAGYLAAVSYVLESLEKYLVERLEGDALVIIVGDHQPPLTIAAASRSKAVPIHVLSRDPKLVEPFRRAGYVLGLTPRAEASAAGMESFMAWLFANFGAVHAAGR